jgi:hypothetical protein
MSQDTKEAIYGRLKRGINHPPSINLTFDKWVSDMLSDLRKLAGMTRCYLCDMGHKSELDDLTHSVADCPVRAACIKAVEGEKPCQD